MARDQDLLARAGLIQAVQQCADRRRMECDFRLLDADKRDAHPRSVSALKQCDQDAERAQCAVRHTGCQEAPGLFRAGNLLPELQHLVGADISGIYPLHTGHNGCQILFNAPFDGWRMIRNPMEDAGNIVTITGEQFAGI